jgi:hypothetical protein
MKRLLGRRSVLVWLVLSVATISSWWISTEPPTDAASVRGLATATILAVAMFKAYCIGHEFMELRHAPRVLRYAFVTWVLGLYGVLVGFYFLR